MTAPTHNQDPAQTSPEASSKVEAAFNEKLWDPNFISDQLNNIGQSVEILSPLELDDPAVAYQAQAYLKLPKVGINSDEQKFAYLEVGFHKEAGWVLASDETDTSILDQPDHAVRVYSRSPLSLGGSLGDRLQIGRETGEERREHIGEGIVYTALGKQPFRVSPLYTKKIREVFGPDTSRVQDIFEITADGIRVTNMGQNGTDIVYKDPEKS